jgi:hypothetical protein
MTYEGLVILLFTVAVSAQLSSAQDYGRWKNCTFVQSNNTTNSFPFGFGCSSITIPVNEYGIKAKTGGSPDKYFILFDNFPMAQFNLCNLEPLISYTPSFNMEQTCSQMFCPQNGSADLSWIDKYITTISPQVALDAAGTKDMIIGLLQDYCFYCKGRPDFYDFQTLVWNRNCSNWNWTVPDAKCGSFDTGVPVSLGLQRRLGVSSPTVCYCHKYDRFRFKCDYIHGMIVFYFEIIPFFRIVVGVFVTLLITILLVIPTWYRRIEQTIKELRVRRSKLEIFSDYIQLRFLVVNFTGLSCWMMLIGNFFTMNLVGIYSERSTLYKHQLDNAFLAFAVFLYGVSIGLTLILWVNVLHESRTLNSEVPLWRKVITFLYAAGLTVMGFFLFLGQSVVERDHILTSVSSYIAYSAGAFFVIVIGLGYLFYGLRLIFLLTQKGNRLSALNMRVRSLYEKLTFSLPSTCSYLQEQQ